MKHKMYLILICSFLSAVYVSNVGATEINRTSLTEKMKKDPKKYRPYSAKYQGELKPANNLQQVLSGKTIVFAQPWVNLKSYQIRTSQIFFRNNRQSTSEFWKDRPWSVSGNKLCINLGKQKSCYLAMSDSANSAYLLDEQTKLLTKVKEINTGDSHQLYAAYAKRQEAIRARRELERQFWNFMAEGMMAAMTSGGGGGVADDCISCKQLQHDEWHQDLRNRGVLCPTC